MEGEDPLQLAVHGSSTQPRDGSLAGAGGGEENEIPSRCGLGGNSRPRRGPGAEQGLKPRAHPGGPDL